MRATRVMSDLDVFPHGAQASAEDGKQRPGWRQKRFIVPVVLVALIAVGSVGGDDKESPEALLSVTNTADSKAKAASDQAERDLAAAEAAAEQAAADRAAAEAAAKEAAEAKAVAEAAALAAQQKAAADKAAAEKAVADKAVADKAVAEQAAAERAAAEKVAAERAAAQKAAAQKAATQPQPLAAAPKGGGCTPEYPDFCIPPAADYNCPDFSQKNFTALRPDPYRLDADNDGVACESR